MSPQLDNVVEHKSARPNKPLKDRSLGSRWAFSKSPVPADEIDPPLTRPPKPAESSRDHGRTLAAAVEKRQSKMNLFDLFTKPKVERARAFHDRVLDTLPERSQTPAHFYRKEESEEKPESAAMDNVQPLSRKPGSRTSSSQKRGPAKLERPPPRDWDAPPLVQAYPQAIKHSALQGTNISPDTLLRATPQRNYDGFGSTLALPFVGENEEAQKHATPTKHVQKRFSTLADSLGVTEKVFVLTTTGRLVQYAGKGKSDRLPERVLQLGHNSAAFASDLIPGKHWVLQVVQSINQDGAAPVKQSRSLLSRLRPSSTAMRKNATGLLMIFDTPDDMDTWLRTLRKTIEQIGGTRIEPDRESATDKRPVESNSTNMQAQKDANQLQALRVDSKTASPPASPKSTGTSILLPPANPPPAPRLPSPPASRLPSPPASRLPSPPVARLPSPPTASRRTSRSDSPRTGLAERTAHSPKVNRKTSTEVSSVAAATVTSSDQVVQVPLEQMRNSSRYSLISSRTSRTSETEAATIPTSCGSSSPPSPRRVSFTEAETQRNPPSLKSFTIGLATTTNFRRMPPQTQATPTSRSSPQIPPRESSARINGRIHGFSESAEVSHIHALTNGPRVRHSLVSEEADARMSRSDPLVRTTISEENGPSERPASFIGQLPNLSSRSINRFDQRIEPSRKPFVRPIPVKPTEPGSTQQRRTSETLLFDHSGAPHFRTTESPTTRRLSSVPNQSISTTDLHNFQFNGRTSLLSRPVSHIASRPLSTNYSWMPPANPNAAVSVNGPTSASAVKQRPSITTQALRRPNSMQIRADHAPFLSSRQPQPRVRGDTRSSSEPSIPYAASHSASCSSLFAAALGPGRTGSMASPHVLSMNPNTPAIHAQSNMTTIVAPGLPPPAHPPPNIPLPKVPGAQAFS